MKKYSVKSDEGVTPPIDEIVMGGDADRAKSEVLSRRPNLKPNDLKARALD